MLKAHTHTPMHVNQDIMARWRRLYNYFHVCVFSCKVWAADVQSCIPERKKSVGSHAGWVIFTGMNVCLLGISSQAAFTESVVIVSVTNTLFSVRELFFHVEPFQLYTLFTGVGLGSWNEAIEKQLTLQPSINMQSRETVFLILSLPPVWIFWAALSKQGGKEWAALPTFKDFIFSNEWIQMNSRCSRKRAGSV